MLKWFFTFVCNKDKNPIMQNRKSNRFPTKKKLQKIDEKRIKSYYWFMIVYNSIFNYFFAKEMLINYAL